MTNERYRELDRTGKGLSVDERRAGWHFCEEFDGLLTDGELNGPEQKCSFCDFDGSKVAK